MSNCGFSHTSYLIISNSFFKLLQTEFNVVEVLDGFTQFRRNVCEHTLEFCERLTHNLGIFDAYTALGSCVGNEHHDTPILFTIEIVVNPFLGGDKIQHFAIDVGSAGSFELLANVSSHFYDVVHQEFDVGEDGHIYVLKHVVGGAARGGYSISSVDESVSEGTNIGNFTFNGELLSNVFKLLFHCIWALVGL